MKLSKLKSSIKFYTGNLKIYQILLIILFFNSLMFYVFYSNAMVFSDFSREVYIPAAMNNGSVLYKDIFNVYAPLGYQINAFLISLFGLNLKTFYFAGFVNSTLILFGLFFILRLFIQKGSVLVLSLLFFIMTANVYAVSQTNYITPYSYSLVYALNCFIWGLAGILYFLKENKRIFLYLAFFFFGISISCKYEFSPFILILISILFYKKTDLKTNIFCILSLLAVPILSLTDLFLKGASFNSLKEAITYMLLLSKAKSVKTLYTYLGFIPSVSSLKILAEYFIKVFLFCAVSSAAFACKYLRFSRRIRTVCFFASIIILLCLFCFLIRIFTVSNAFYFNWTGVFAIILFVCLCIKLLKKSKEKTVNIQDKLFFVLFASTILCSFKCIFNISFNSYGTYYFPLLFICCILYLYIYKLELLKRNKNKHTAYALIVFLIFEFGSIYYLSNFYRVEQVFGFCRVNIEQPLAPGLEQIEALYETVNYIKENTNKDDTLLVLPEGAIINFLTGRKSHNKYYYLIPPNIEIFGEDNIVQDLEKDLPAYIVIQPMSYNNFKETFFCESFGTEICSLIPKYYEKPVVFGKDFWIAVYKKKN